MKNIPKLTGWECEPLRKYVEQASQQVRQDGSINFCICTSLLAGRRSKAWRSSPIIEAEKDLGAPLGPYIQTVHISY